MFQAPFNSSCVALQYEPGTKFFHRAVPEIHASKISAKISFLRIRPRVQTNETICLVLFLKVIQGFLDMLDCFLMFLEACFGLPNQPVVAGSSSWIKKV